jgi:flagellar biosynthesis GTPase FlhF
VTWAYNQTQCCILITITILLWLCVDNFVEHAGNHILNSQGIDVDRVNTISSGKSFYSTPLPELLQQYQKAANTTLSPEARKSQQHEAQQQKQRQKEQTERLAQLLHAEDVAYQQQQQQQQQSNSSSPTTNKSSTKSNSNASNTSYTMTTATAASNDRSQKQQQQQEQPAQPTASQQTTGGGREPAPKLQLQMTPVPSEPGDDSDTPPAPGLRKCVNILHRTWLSTTPWQPDNGFYQYGRKTRRKCKKCCILSAKLRHQQRQSANQQVGVNMAIV